MANINIADNQKYIKLANPVSQGFFSHAELGGKTRSIDEIKPSHINVVDIYGSVLKDCRQNAR